MSAAHTPSTPSAELEACPFCGCSMRLESNRDWHRIFGDHDESCPFDGQDETLMSPATDDQLALLYRDWNRRKASACNVVLGLWREAEA